MGEKRRAESDARLEYCYSFLSDATALNRNDLSAQIHEGSLGPRFNQMFLPNAPSSLLLYHQEDVSDTVQEPGEFTFCHRCSLTYLTIYMLECRN